jgi:glycerol-3-phosphate dehydrogenase
VFAGTLTTHRRLAEHVMNEFCRILPWSRQGRTRTEILPGGDFGPDGKAVYEQALRNSIPWLSDRQLARYVQQYGRRTDELLDGALTFDDLGECFGADLYKREVDFLIRTQWAATVEVIWRRTKVGLQLSAEKRDRLNQYLTGVLRARG